MSKNSNPELPMYSPVKKNRRYFFAYHLTNGIPFPFMWAEDHGISCGGRPNPVPSTVMEITEEEFEKGELTPLEKENPFPKDLLDIIVSPSEEPNST